MTALSELSSFLPLLAVGLDLLIGDPRWLPHPVRIIGNIADGLESLTRNLLRSIPLKFVGILATMTLVIVVALTVFGLTSMGTVGFFVTLYLCSAGLALRCLLSEANTVHQLLKHGQLTEAKVALSMLVSRDTLNMSEAEVRRSLAETLSENLNDGFTAPLFWLCVGGPVAMWVYKTISTLDSMWGYKTEKYKDFGWFAAKTDDVLAYVPARLTALAMVLVGVCMRFNGVKSLKRIVRDARTMESPNAGWPMAAAAWLVGAQMGGRTSYQGEIKQKPLLGPHGEAWTTEQFYSLRSLIFWSGVLLALIGQISSSALPYLYK